MIFLQSYQVRVLRLIPSDFDIRYWGFLHNAPKRGNKARNGDLSPAARSESNTG